MIETKADLAKLTVKQLRRMARAWCIKGRSRMLKATLVEAIWGAAEIIL